MISAPFSVSRSWRMLGYLAQIQPNSVGYTLCNPIKSGEIRCNSPRRIWEHIVVDLILNRLIAAAIVAGKGCKLYYCAVAIYNAILSKTKSNILVGCAW